jgi:hypothetical protein
MEPKLKAVQIIMKMQFQKEPLSFAQGKKCALIAVDDIIKYTRSVNTMPPNCQKIDKNTKEYWLKVKQEIEKL